MNLPRLAIALLGGIAAIALEAIFPPALRIGGNAPDLLAAVAAFAAARPDGALVAPVLLGAVRDGLAGGVPGRYAVGYLIAAIALRAAAGRLRERGLGVAVAAAALAALVAHGFAEGATAALGRAPLGAVPRDASLVALAAGAFAPVVVIPLAALETLLGDDARPRPSLAGRR